MMGAVDVFEGKSRYYGHFYYCWLNGSITTKELYIHVENGLITDEERTEIMANPRGKAFPDEV